MMAGSPHRNKKQRVHISVIDSLAAFLSFCFFSGVVGSVAALCRSFSGW